MFQQGSAIIQVCITMVMSGKVAPSLRNVGIRRREHRQPGIYRTVIAAAWATPEHNTSSARHITRVRQA